MKKILSLTFLSLFLLLKTTAQTTITWNGDGASDFSWNDADNWDLDRVPMAGDDVIIPPGSGNATFGVVLDVNATVASITIQSSPAGPPMFPFGGTPAVPTVFNVGFDGFFATTLTITNDITFTGGEVTTTIPASSAIIASGELSGDFDELVVSTNGELSIGGDITPSSGLITNNGTIRVGGSLPSTGIVLNTPNTVNYFGNTSQTITAITYDNLTFSGTGTKTIEGTLSYNNLTFTEPQSVTFDTDLPLLIPNAGDYNILTFKGTGEKSINSNLTVGSLIIDPVDLPSVNYNGTTTQTIIESTYQNLTFSNSGLKVVPVTPTVNGTFSAGGTDVEYSGNADQNILAASYGDLTFSGTGIKNIITQTPTISLSGTFNPGTSTVSYSGTMNQTILDLGSPYYSLSIDGTGNKTIPDDIELQGNLINNGTLVIAPNKTVSLTGTDASSISGTNTITVQDLTIAKTADVDVTITGDVIMNSSGVLTLSSANDGLVIDPSGSLTLKATGSNTYATVAELPNGAGISGAITAEGFFDPTDGTRGWWHVSSPVQGASGNDWLDDVIITGDFSGNRNDDVNGTDFQSMYAFDETLPGTQNASWVDFPSASSAETMETGRGYRIFIRDDLSTATAKTVDLSGTLHQGDIDIPVTFTNNMSVDNDGWNLIGNPYPATLDWTNVGKSDLNRPEAYVWDATAKNYTKFGSGITIAPFQAFFVQASTTGFVNLQETDKASAQTALQRTSPDDNVINVVLQEIDDERPYRTTSTVIRVNPEATSNSDKGLDIAYLSRNMFRQNDESPLIDIASLSEDGIKHFVNVIPESENDQIIPLHVVFSDFEKLTLSINTENYEYGSSIMLEDKYLNVLVPLSSNNEINYDFELDENESSKASNRFQIVVNAEPLSISSSTKNSSLSIYPNPAKESFNYSVNWAYANVELSISDMVGNVISSQAIKNNDSSLSGNVDVSNLEKGIYNVSITSGNNVVTEKLIIK